MSTIIEIRANLETLAALAHETDQAERRILAAALERLETLRGEPGAEDDRRTLIGIVGRARELLAQWGPNNHLSWNGD
ncbi:hypothetical protein [Pseudomonas sp. A-B-19]|uniref:hypothetical protein n=1 Tax=Pseudomonas sp. A-B-19 TaxID=2832405 RepID=UPI001CBB2817|nr:hypothetical protein [Pseudomonas sp. A-B-19]